jgi:transcriptional regulator with XRE-family HTH domain
MANANQRAGQEVRRLRTDRGWTHEDMSAEIFREYGVRCQTSARTIWRVESGHKPGVRKQFAIAMVLGVVPSQLWNNTPRRVSA